MDVDFYKQYVNINFDEILRENNNPLVTSQTVYLNFKKDYVDKTLQAYDSFNKYNSELQSLENVNGYSSDTKHVYVYKNDKRIQELRQQIKNIVIDQERRFNDFYHYITLLNTNREIFETKSLQQSEKRSFFSKLFDKK
jgi:hypothetical protein